MRDNFTNKTKDIIAKRVAWRCSFPGCNIITVGAGHDNNSQVINLGEAAHINAASKNGPRYDNSMTLQQRISVDNGIWMCRHHARLIDSDYFNYSAQTLRQWKRIAECKTYDYLQTLKKELSTDSTTLISIGQEIVFEGIWKSAIDGVWKFEIVSFIIGTIDKIINYSDTNKFIDEKYIVIETQGDGRFFEGNLDWEFTNERYVISLRPNPKTQRRTPYNFKDISMDFEIENGDLKMVEGEECARQIITLTLSTEKGDMWFSPNYGSFLSIYYWNFKDNLELLKRLVKLEITRLISIPHKESIDSKGSPPLDFINRINDVEIIDIEICDHKIPLNIRLEWGDGKAWEGKIEVFIKPKSESHYKNKFI